MFRFFTFSLSLLVVLITSAQDTTKDTIKDIDGNVYHTIKIGNQRWMHENLKTTHYRDGSPISEVKDSAQWANTSQSRMAAWCYYDNNAGNNPTYGKLYNWYAVADSHHLCPTGWHVPTDTEFNILTDYLGGDTVAGGKMKAKTLWDAPNTGADNSSGYTALPAGGCGYGGTFNFLGDYGNFWSSTEDGSNSAWLRFLGCSSSHVDRVDGDEGSGLSVRCVGD
jgi:uncharacterized protein (TIGR02145 family)